MEVRKCSKFGTKNESANLHANKKLQIWNFEKGFKFGTKNESANLYANKQLKIWNFNNVSNLEQKRKCKFARKLTSCEVGC